MLSTPGAGATAGVRHLNAPQRCDIRILIHPVRPGHGRREKQAIAMDFLPQPGPNATGPQFLEQIFRSAGAGSRPRAVRLMHRPHRRYPALGDAGGSAVVAAEIGVGETLTQNERDGAGWWEAPRHGAQAAVVQRQRDDQPTPEYAARHTVEGAVVRIGREQYPPGSPGVER